MGLASLVPMHPGRCLTDTWAAALAGRAQGSPLGQLGSLLSLPHRLFRSACDHAHARADLCEHAGLWAPIHRTSCVARALCAWIVAA